MSTPVFALVVYGALGILILTNREYRTRLYRESARRRLGLSDLSVDLLAIALGMVFPRLGVTALVTLGYWAFGGGQ